jgi:hypothetical protein
MAYTTINKSSAHFDVKLWTGNGSSQTITGYEFQPDLAWIKARTSTGWHDWTDAVRGATKSIFSNSTDAEDTSATSLTAFTSDGYSFGTNSQVNGNGTTYVGWNWKANGAGSANTDGSINTTATSANTTAGFSIVKYTGTGSNATIGHGLGVAPKMIIVKNLTDARSWGVYHASLGATQGIDLDGTGAAGSASSYWNDTAPTTSVFSIGTANNTGAAQTYVAYCFAEKTGFSKFGSYVGNGNTDGAFVYTGFKPAFVMLKYASPSGGVGNWGIHDSKRDVDNPVQKGLIANSTAIEDSHDFMDILSNGFKLKSTSSNRNENGSTYIFMAFAEAPLVGSNNTPATAR